MNSKGIIAIPQEKIGHICFNCLTETDNLHKISIPAMGYGSSFDNLSTEVHLCDKCYKESNPEIWSMEEVSNEYYQEYVHEEEMLDYIKKLPLQSQEFVWNIFAYGACADNSMESQDWIDYELDELPHDKCKEYGYYSPEEKIAYKERFPTCDKVYKEVYGDGSAGCWCKNGANGNADGICGDNISDKCYMCKDYIPRKDAIRVINQVDEYIKNETKRLNDMLIYAQDRLKLITDNPKGYFEQYN